MHLVKHMRDHIIAMLNTVTIGIAYRAFSAKRRYELQTPALIRLQERMFRAFKRHIGRRTRKMIATMDV
jgi:phosphate uptake regulator